jgi:hypothetical protein
MICSSENLFFISNLLCLWDWTLIPAATQFRGDVDEALYSETRFGKAFLYWIGIIKIVRRPGFMVIYPNNLATFIIPNRAFSSPERRQLFFEAVKEKLAAK